MIDAADRGSGTVCVAGNRRWASGNGHTRIYNTDPAFYGCVTMGQKHWSALDGQVWSLRLGNSTEGLSKKGCGRGLRTRVADEGCGRGLREMVRTYRADGRLCGAASLDWSSRLCDNILSNGTVVGHRA